MPGRVVQAIFAFSRSEAVRADLHPTPSCPPARSPTRPLPHAHPHPHLTLARAIPFALAHARSPSHTHSHTHAHTLALTHACARPLRSECCVLICGVVGKVGARCRRRIRPWRRAASFRSTTASCGRMARQVGPRGARFLLRAHKRMACERHLDAHSADRTWRQLGPLSYGGAGSHLTHVNRKPIQDDMEYEVAFNYKATQGAAPPHTTYH